MGRHTDKTRAQIFLDSLEIGMSFRALPGYLSMPYNKSVLTLERIGEHAYKNIDDCWLYMRTETGEEVDCRLGWLRRFWRVVVDSKPAQVSSDGLE